MVDNNLIRQIAHKVSIGQIHSAQYVNGDEQNPNYLLVGNQATYRINTIGIVINKETLGTITNLLLDDGTGYITIRFFEENKTAATIPIGNTALIIGRVRLYNQERYISPEIIKEIDRTWLKVRHKERPEIFELSVQENSKPVTKIQEHQESKSPQQEIVDEKLITAQDPLLPSQKVANIIRDLDKGEGVYIEEIIEKCPLHETEQVLEKMLERGEIFQNQPGKVKVL